MVVPELLIFQNEEDRTSAERLCRRWQNLIRLRAASLGFAFDTLPDLARLLRVPGTQNCKDPKSPRPVHIFSRITAATTQVISLNTSIWLE